MRLGGWVVLQGDTILIGCWVRAAKSTSVGAIAIEGAVFKKMILDERYFDKR